MLLSIRNYYSAYPVWQVWRSGIDTSAAPPRQEAIPHTWRRRRGCSRPRHLRPSVPAASRATASPSLASAAEPPPLPSQPVGPRCWSATAPRWPCGSSSRSTSSTPPCASASALSTSMPSNRSEPR